MLKTKEQKLHNIKTMGKVSSARLAVNNHYVLDENFLECLEEIEHCAEAAKAKSKQKHYDSKTNRSKVLQLSRKSLHSLQTS
jgi:predicted metallo-beta-lactamase superfamily hydrolase